VEADAEIAPAPVEAGGKAVDLRVHVADRLPLHGALELSNTGTRETSEARLYAMVRYSGLVRPDDTTQRDYRGPGFVTPPPKKKETEPTSIKGRYVRIELPGKKRILSMAEVEVFCKEENIAPKGKATQSSTSSGGDPARANDGNKNGDWKNGSITHTDEENNPWWELDLGRDYDIRKVVVHNRMDEKGKLAGRLKDFTLKILDKDRKVMWQKEKVPAPKPYYVLFPK